MTTAPRTKLGFLSASGRRGGGHYDDFLALVPPELEVTVQGLGLYGASLGELAGRTDDHLAMSAELVRERGWDGIAIMGAPMEVENPGFADRLREALDVPVTTALGAGAASLRALGVRRAVLLTPFDERLKGMLRDHLASVGIDAVLPTDAFASVADAMRATPEEVYRLAVDAVAAADGVEAVYFQGAPLNPIAVIERIESDLGIPVVASNPAMLWRLASLLGHTFSVPNAGRLLREWPASA